MRIRRENALDIIRFLQMDFTELVLRTGIIEEKDAYWKDVIQMVNSISGKYKDNRFVAHMLNSYLSYLDELSKTIYGKGGEFDGNEESGHHTDLQ